MAGTRKVLVVGGGIAGLTLAVALRRRDVSVDVVEIQPRWNVLGVGIGDYQAASWIGCALMSPHPKTAQELKSSNGNQARGRSVRIAPLH